MEAKIILFRWSDHNTHEEILERKAGRRSVSCFCQGCRKPHCGMATVAVSPARGLSPLEGKFSAARSESGEGP